MELSPEERQKIYEEERARIETKGKKPSDQSSTNLEPNIAGLLCYLGFWISGLVFLILEQKNRFVRLHALQSIILFGTLTVAGTLLTQIPFIGGFFGAVIGILIFVFWILLMVKAYQGQWFKILLAGDLAERALPVEPPDTSAKEEVIDNTISITPTTEAPTPPPEPRVGKITKGARPGRIVASSMAIAWSLILIVFLNFFSEYIAYYEAERVGDVTIWVRSTLITSSYYTWLPILNTTLIVSIVGHIILLIFDNYILRQLILILINLFGIATVLMLLSIFPFDFTVIPFTTLANVLPFIVAVVLIAISVGLGIGSLVMLIQLLIKVLR